MSISFLMGVDPRLNEALNDVALYGSLPFISGKWFFVNPSIGTSRAGGETIKNPVDTIETAYDRCISGRGDGICVMSYGITTAGTTSYLTKTLNWSKHGITVVGIAAPSIMYGRARIANKKITTGSISTISFTDSGTADYITDSASGFLTAGFEVGQKIRVDSTSNTNDGVYTILSVTASRITLTTDDSLTTEAEGAEGAGATTITNYLTDIIDVQGDNNTFINLHIANFDTDELAVGGLKVTGNRNTFINVHAIGAGGASAAATHRSLELTSCEEIRFVNCVFGTDTVDRGNNASCEILLGATVYRVTFENCMTLAYVSSGTAHGAIKSSGATALGRDLILKDFNALCFATAQASAFIGTAPTAGKIYIIGNSSSCGYSAWDSSTSNLMVYVGVPTHAANAAGGIPTTKTS